MQGLPPLPLLPTEVLSQLTGFPAPARDAQHKHWGSAALPAPLEIPKAQPFAVLAAAGMKPVLPAQITCLLGRIRWLLAKAQKRNHVPVLEVKNIN